MKKRLTDHFAAVSDFMGAVCIIVLTCLIGCEVVLRSVFGVSTLVSDEYSGYLMVFIVYWGAASAFHSDSFVRVEVLFKHFKPGVQKVLNVVYDISFLIFNSYLLYFFFRSFRSVLKYNSVASTVARTPLWIPYGICLLGIVVFELYLTVSIVDSIVLKEKTGGTGT